MAASDSLFNVWISEKAEVIRCRRVRRLQSARLAPHQNYLRVSADAAIRMKCGLFVQFRVLKNTNGIAIVEITRTF